MQHKRRFRLPGLFLCLCLLLCSCAQQKEQPITEPADQDYIKWIDFDIPEPVLTRALGLDVEGVNSDCHVGWVELLSLWAARNGGSFEDCRPDDLQKLLTVKQPNLCVSVCPDLQPPRSIRGYFYIRQMPLGPFQKVHIAKDAVIPEKVLILQITAAAPF